MDNGRESECELPTDIGNPAISAVPFFEMISFNFHILEV